MLRFLIPLIFIILGFTQVVLPLAVAKPLFPLIRGCGRLLKALLAPTGARRLEESAKNRLLEAERRRKAALMDAEAAKLEAEADGLEDEAFRKRTGMLESLKDK